MFVKVIGYIRRRIVEDGVLFGNHHRGKFLSYAADQFIEEIVKPHADLVLVNVKKNRDIYKIDCATVEIAEAEFNGAAWRTMCAEHEDSEMILRGVEKFGMNGVQNMNYIQAMEKSVGVV